MIHTRRRDLSYKLLLLLSRSLHWFNPLVHWMAAAASRDLERSCDEAAVAGRDAAFRAAYGAALLDAVEEGIEARAPLTTHFRGGKAAMKERLLSIASGGTRKKGVALVCAAALVISAGVSGSKERITEREYWAAKKGQLALDKENAAREAAGQPTKPTKFETDKAKLRRTIRQALSQAGSFDEFSSLLLREGVTVKESRGRLSYLTPDRTKPITARKLGDDFDKAAVLALLTQNAHRAAEQTKAIPEYPAAVKKPLQGEKAAKTTPADNTLQRMIDREAKRAEGKGVGYDRWASLHNLKQMAATHNFLMENELLDLDKLDAAVESSRKALSEARESLRGIEQSISDKKSLRKVVNDYRRTRPTIDAHKKLSGRKAENYRQSHEAEFIIYEAALRQLKVLAPGKKLPATSKLNTEIEALISEKNAAYNTYRTAKAEYEQLATAKRNAEQILHGTPSRQKKHEQER